MTMPVLPTVLREWTHVEIGLGYDFVIKDE